MPILFPNRIGGKLQNPNLNAEISMVQPGSKRIFSVTLNQLFPICGDISTCGKLEILTVGDDQYFRLMLGTPGTMTTLFLSTGPLKIGESYQLSLRTKENPATT